MTERAATPYRTPAGLPSIRDRERDTLLRLPADALEVKQFMPAVIAYAQRRGWRVAHFYAARVPSGRIITPAEGDKGFVDLVLARGGVVHHWELKSKGNYPEPEQRAWQEAIGATARVFWPKDAAEIVDLLE